MSKQQSTKSILGDIGTAIDTLESQVDWLDDTDRLDLLAMMETLESMADAAQNQAAYAKDESNYRADVAAQNRGY